jgi:cytochrome b subunit of formate dehydrogenase
MRRNESSCTPGVSLATVARAHAAPWIIAASALLLFLGATNPVLAAAPAADADTEQQDDAEKKDKPDTKADCLDCHDDPELTDDAGKKSMTLTTADYNKSSHRKLDCAECHENALNIKHPRKRTQIGPVDPKTCDECHEDAFSEITGGGHGKHSGTDKAIRDCDACHGPTHSPKAKISEPGSPMSVAKQIKTCGDCHKKSQEGYNKSEHARALLKAGLEEGAPTCSSCHGSHEMHKKTDKDGSISYAGTPKTCGTCHKGILNEWVDSAHGTLWKEGKKSKEGKQGPVCATCHQSHAIGRADKAVIGNQVAGQCGDCHKELYETFRDSFHGKATSLKNTQAAVCADCHTPHHNLPASDPRSSINKKNLAKTCGACHDNVNASFLTFDPHAKPNDPNRNIYLYWVWFAMTGLLLGVFGFFGLHDILWLQRAIVGKLRGEFKFGHGGQGQYVRRFSSMQMGVHVAVVVSFLTLAATGLPLKFAAATWAPTLMAILGGAEFAGVLHRLAALITFCYFAWHLSMLAHGLIVKKERGYFWGPRSMTPQPRDIADIWRMLKYFLYLGPRPKFDRFTYWEKFDYLAVFWGVAIIGLSGLVLWLPTLATSVLPGWALNAAYVMHSDEALLATGFIFFFHFFHTHLRPEAFPMDPVIFTGRMPLERFKDERPLEYERLVASGELDQYLVPPPTASDLRRAYIFGFAAVAIGIALAVMIFWALLSGLLH